MSIKGTILYCHPTYIGKQTFPTTLNDETLAVASIYLANNFAIIFSNYPGFAEDDLAQPFLLYPTITICSIFTLFHDPSLKALLTSIPNGKKLYPIGFSEGGFFSVFISKLKDSL
jgi:hypothetical protein